MMLSVIQKVLPDAYKLLLRRYHILNVIKQEGPIGRRMLAEKMQLTERLTRSEVDALKKYQLISTSKAGMVLTAEGVETLEQLQELLEEHNYLFDLQNELAEFLEINSCSIVPGDLDKDVTVLYEMAKKAVELINHLLGDGEQIIAVMGGTTLNEIANHMDNNLGYNRDLLFVPARGGLGDDAMLEANVIAQRMAQQTGGHSHGLYAPEHVHEEIYEELLKEPEIKKTLQIVESASLILYSIGTPIEMAKRRGLEASTLELLKEKEAVAEAFGEFINKDGEVVYKLSNIGLQSSSLKKIEYIVTVAGGKSKATAISSYLKTAPSHTWLITDEAAANEILNGGNPLK
ncbi:MAG TPA: sugar-binding domain-containing protein [Atopostipes sp.]|nr:sugar-binding domain-containing protein [Atopostipes sp.]